jgi:hypothetical protein
MTKAEQTRLLTWRFKLLQRAGASPRNVARACRHFGISVSRSTSGRSGTTNTHRKRWQRSEKPQPGHRLQMDVKFLERIAGTGKRL